ncbi:MAG: DUF4258 domain-containing protein [Candidatus Binataceae bacterium]
MPGPRLVYRIHAIERMVERGTSDEDVRQVLAEGEIIESYPDDYRHPSRLLLGWRDARPIHIVTAANPVDDEMEIVAVYEPDSERWEPGFARRKSR